MDIDESTNPWQVAKAADVYENHWIRVRHHEVLTPGGTNGVYGTVHCKHIAVGIVPIDSDGHTYLVGQFRFPVNRYSWEIPEGGGVLGVLPEESAARELREETGLSAQSWLPIVDCFLSNCITDERAIAFLAWDICFGTASPESTEQLQVKRLPLKEAFRMVSDGVIVDALSILALQSVQLMIAERRLPQSLQRIVHRP